MKDWVKRGFRVQGSSLPHTVTQKTLISRMPSGSVCLLESGSERPSERRVGSKWECSPFEMNEQFYFVGWNSSTTMGY